MLQAQAMSFSLARTCESAVKQCLTEMGLSVGSAAVEQPGSMENWIIFMEVESSQGAHVSITFSGSASDATSKSMGGR